MFSIAKLKYNYLFFSPKYVKQYLIQKLFLLVHSMCWNLKTHSLYILIKVLNQSSTKHLFVLFYIILAKMSILLNTSRGIMCHQLFCIVC